MPTAEQIVNNHIIYCVTTMMCELDSVAEKLDGYEDYLDLQYNRDFREPAADFILEADLSDLERVAELLGDWEDVLTEVGLVTDVTEIVKSSDEDGDEEMYFDLEEWLKDQPDYKERVALLKSAVIKLLDEWDDNPEKVCNEFGLDPYENEVYEHWIVTDWLGERLTRLGETVREYLGLTIWGRRTTGQSISMDYVIRKIAGEE